MKRVEIGIRSFADSRNDGSAYVDKTDEMLIMVSGYYVEERMEG